METSPLLPKGYTFWPLLGTHCHWALKVLYSCDTEHFKGHLHEPWTFIRVAERETVEVSLPVLTTNVCRGRISNQEIPHARRKFCQQSCSYWLHVTSFKSMATVFGKRVCLHKHEKTDFFLSCISMNNVLFAFRSTSSLTAYVVSFLLFKKSIATNWLLICLYHNACFMRTWISGSHLM